ncbi:MAG: formylglycine-generating enzyme family protein [Nitrososphaerota archaeon]|jgi:formylglycine-generating enzyme required for sulfatase activity|nr:formylglycine-generating enzyme family protein [Nitrososphaerota archaeon]
MQLYNYDKVSEIFECNTGHFFNIYDKHGVFIADFLKNITDIIEEINGDSDHPIRFIWIDAATYCQAEVFLKKIFRDSTSLPNPVLYIHWLTNVPSFHTITSVYTSAKADSVLFRSISNKGVKICVIDHAEEITKVEDYTALCGAFNDNKVLFIFIAKKNVSSSSFWPNLYKDVAKLQKPKPFSGILCSGDNYFTVKPYICSNVVNIINLAPLTTEISAKVVNLIATLPPKFFKPFYLDKMITTLKDYTVDSMPNNLSDPVFINAIHGKAIKTVINHLISSSQTFNDYIQRYYNDDFHDTCNDADQVKLNNQSVAWACGIINYAKFNSFDYQAIISKLFTDFSLYRESINVVCELIVTESIEQNTDKELVFNVFLQLAKHSVCGAQSSATMLTQQISCSESIPKSLFTDQQITDVFGAIVEKYDSEISDTNDSIRDRFLLGMKIGELLPLLKVSIVANKLQRFYKTVNDTYLVPQCTKNGVAVIPVTNFEYMKFIADSTDHQFFWPIENNSLQQVAKNYYTEILEYLEKTINSTSKKDRTGLAILLKGYDFEHYCAIASIYLNCDKIKQTDVIGSAINEHYNKDVWYPAKWKNSANNEWTRPFCNPLQPVVCINYFEAKAYAQWLSKKISKKVHLVRYDPDYISIVGTRNESDHKNCPIRNAFLMIKNNLAAKGFINVSEHSHIFYDKDKSGIREPSPVGVIPISVNGVYDLLGNIFEIQETEYTYTYAERYKTFAQKKEEHLKDYNCAGGGLQRPLLNCPPVYMGQTPAFLRNQDIGFRIVISDDEGGSKKHKTIRPRSRSLYGSPCEEHFTCQNTSNLLDNISIVHNDNGKKFNKSKIYTCNSKNIVLFSLPDTDNHYKESIMLVLNGKNIYAYHLIGTPFFSTTSAVSEEIKTVCRVAPINTSTYKKYNNQNYADWVELVQVFSPPNNIAYYTTYPLNISNGCFTIEEKNVRKDIKLGKEIKEVCSLAGTYEITFCVTHSERATFFDTVKDLLASNILPDWIDVGDYIRHLSTTSPDLSEKASDIFFTLSTIDTADLHKQLTMYQYDKVER